MPNFHVLELPWGLQVSFCTGIARKVPLRELIEDSLFGHVDNLGIEQYEGLQEKARATFRWSTDFGEWIKGLKTQEKTCLTTVVGYLLQILENTGLDRESKRLSILWPQPSSAMHGIEVFCDSSSNSWARILRDSEWCVTFAAVTSLCLESATYGCRGIEGKSHIGLIGGPCLSTLIGRYVPAEAVTYKRTAESWKLQDDKKYWMGSVGSDILVEARKKGNSDIQLVVKNSRYPMMVARRLGF